MLTLRLKYVEGRTPVVTGLKRISKPGLRVYARKTEIPRVLGGLGIAILSTSHGIMTGTDARKQNLGGEVLCLHLVEGANEACPVSDECRSRSLTEWRSPRRGDACASRARSACWSVSSMPR